MGFIGEKEMSNEDDFKIILYSLYKCWPEEGKNVETIYSGSGKRIPKDVQELLMNRIKRHIRKTFSKSTFENKLKKMKDPILVVALKSTQTNVWKTVSLKIANKYAKQDRAKNAIIMTSKFSVKSNSFVCVLRYNLTEQMQLDEAEDEIMKLKIVDQILEEETSKSALYPSTTSIERVHFDPTMVKIHDPNETEHFRNTIDIDELPPHKQIDKELKRLIDEAKETGKSLKIEVLIQKLRELISSMNEKYRRSIKSKITIRIGNIKVEADVSKIFNDIQIEQVGNINQKISITGSNATIKYDNEEYDIIL